MRISLRQMTAEDLPVFQKWLYAPHVARWYSQPADWIREVEEQAGEFRWIHHFIVQQEDRAIGLCQYYACKDSDEPWAGYTALGGSYSVDYMIGEAGALRKGFGKQILAELTARIEQHSDTERIVVQPEAENTASCRLLLSCGFALDTDTGIYVQAVSGKD